MSISDAHLARGCASAGAEERVPVERLRFPDTARCWPECAAKRGVAHLKEADPQVRYDKKTSSTLYYRSGSRASANRSISRS